MMEIGIRIELLLIELVDSLVTGAQVWLCYPVGLQPKYLRRSDNYVLGQDDGSFHRAT